jgi:hypothetical protein
LSTIFDTAAKNQIKLCQRKALIHYILFIRLCYLLIKCDFPKQRYTSCTIYIPVTYTHCLSVCLLLISAYVTFLLSFHFTPIVILSFTQNMLVLCYSSIVTNTLPKNKSSERDENLHTICNHDAYTEFKPSLKTKQRLPLIFKLFLSIYIAPTKIYRMIYNLSRRSISIRKNHVIMYI